VVYLVKNGVPLNRAMKMSPARRLAHIVALGEIEGRAFNWNKLEWEKQ